MGYKLTQVEKNITTIATFVYDGDGNRVSSTINGTTTKFVGEYYEVTGTDITKYYGKTALRKNGVLTYLLADHLGSNSYIVDTSGTKLSETRYTAWGVVRYSSGTSSTPYTYTGQYSNTSDFGWMYYKARWYDPELGRFNQPDSIVLNVYDLNDWNKYAYTSNNPIKFTDPDGNDEDCGIGDQYCSDIKHQMAKTDWPENLSLKMYVTGKEAAEFYNNNPEEAITADLGQKDSYMFASIYTEYVKHETFYPYGVDVVLDKIDTSRIEGSKDQFFSLLFGLGAARFFENDKGYGGGARNNFSTEQNALIQISKDYERTGGVSQNQAQILEEWANEYGLNFRGPEIHRNRNFNLWHIHIGPIGHIPIIDE